MRIVAKRTLVTFIERHAQSEQQLLAWYAEASKANWKTPQDIKNQYANASFVGRNRVVFNIKGNDFRLIVAVAYQIGVVYVKFVGTHAEYDKADAATVEME
ncbi:addiction module toxin RelE [Burkholderia territorii]|uniref:Addiction module toxin RelE n=1 Tax=Burkholderia territorii TaxID=1503055 RepID=A0A108EAZ8_9BURK|nr:type II toxin-antitoxin system HigB family toxin [Burkholderia territorii]KAB0686387.1 type II toxin-antitoxin system HigB family toxin [Burkholderia territorii]KWN07946.1 addiction module toxin RelE [Burkholderia territorii]MBM2772558.1 type II toxin-antitoxin system HigB family toxin [Burkholderia territorii]